VLRHSPFHVGEIVFERAVEKGEDLTVADVKIFPEILQFICFF